MIVTPLILYLIRHGTDSSEALERFSDDRLTTEGIDQITKVAELMKNEGISLLYTSPSVPAIESAELISSITGITMKVDERIRSRELGEVHGLTYNQVRQRYSDLLRKSRFDKNWGFPGGETNNEIFLRSYDFAREIISISAGQRQKIAIVSHNMVINYLIYGFQGLSYQSKMFYHLDGGSIAVLRRTAKEFSMRYLGKL